MKITLGFGTGIQVVEVPDHRILQMLEFNPPTASPVERRSAGPILYSMETGGTQQCTVQTGRS